MFKRRVGERVRTRLIERSALLVLLAASSIPAVRAVEPPAARPRSPAFDFILFGEPSTDYQPLRKVSFTVTSAMPPRKGQATDWKAEGDIHNVAPGKTGEVTIPLHGYDFGGGAQRMPKVNVNITAMVW